MIENKFLRSISRSLKDRMNYFKINFKPSFLLQKYWKRYWLWIINNDLLRKILKVTNTEFSFLWSFEDFILFFTLQRSWYYIDNY